MSRFLSLCISGCGGGRPWFAFYLSFVLTAAVPADGLGTHWPHAWAVHVGTLKLLEISLSGSRPRLCSTFVLFCFVSPDRIWSIIIPQLPSLSGGIILRGVPHSVLAGPGGTDPLSTVVFFLLVNVPCIGFLPFFIWIPHSPRRDDT